MRATKMALMKPASASFWTCVLARIVAARNAAYDRLCARTEPSRQQAQRARQLGVRRGRAGRQQPLLAAQRHQHRDRGREREREAVQTGRVAADHEQQTAREDAHRAFGAVHEPVRAEPAVARERAARDEREEVADDRRDQADEQQPLPVEERVHDRVLEHEREHHGAGGQHRRRAPRPASPTDRRRSRARRCASARATSCSSGWKRPGRHDEDHGPEAVERGVVELLEPVVGEDLEAVRGDARDQEPGADRVGALGHVALGGVDEALGAKASVRSPV